MEIKKEWDKLTPEERRRIVKVVDETNIDVTEEEIEEYLKEKWSAAFQINAFESLVFHMGMDNNNIKVETEAKDEAGNPLMTFEIDENGQFVDRLSQIIFKVVDSEANEPEFTIQIE